MKTYDLLVTNDDGGNSPAVRPLLSALRAEKWCGALHAVFPAEEQSWIAQAVTRFRPVFTREHSFELCDGYLVSGTPADCVGLGLYELHPKPADFVISGMNIGTNATLPFFLSSGTVGGARQAFTFGVRSIAFSAIVPEKVFKLWRADDKPAMAAHAADWQRLTSRCANIAAALVDDRCWSGVDLYSVNLPWESEPTTPVKLTRLADARYQSLYCKRGDSRYEHHFRGFQPKKESAAAPNGSFADDVDVLQAGEISVTPVVFRLDDILPETKAALIQNLK